ncbi:hypothetical protein [Rhodococcus jostii]|uniref:hypothetical protein n=1 Tax=Rhodococcus jostii TaxID=132919 RepID=UPI00362BAC34
MTEDHTTRTRRTVSLRKLLNTSLAVSVLAGAVWAGTGVGTAAPHEAPPSAPSTGASSDERWHVANDTDKTLIGEFYRQNHNNTSEAVFMPPQKGVLPGQAQMSNRRQETNMFWYTYTWGRVCFKGFWWDLPKREDNWDDDVHLYSASPDELYAQVGRASGRAPTRLTKTAGACSVA